MILIRLKRLIFCFIFFFLLVWNDVFFIRLFHSNVSFLVEMMAAFELNVRLLFFRTESSTCLCWNEINLHFWMPLNLISTHLHPIRFTYSHPFPFYTKKSIGYFQRILHIWWKFKIMFGNINDSLEIVNKSLEKKWKIWKKGKSRKKSIRKLNIARKHPWKKNIR